MDIITTDVLIKVSIVIKFYNQHSLGRKAYFILKLVVYHLEKSGQELTRRPWRSAYLWACFACFLTVPMTASLGVALLTVSWASYSVINQENAHRPTEWGHFFSWSFLFQNDTGLCQVDISSSLISFYFMLSFFLSNVVPKTPSLILYLTFEEWFPITQFIYDIVLSQGYNRNSAPEPEMSLRASYKSGHRADWSSGDCEEAVSAWRGLALQRLL